MNENSHKNISYKTLIDPKPLHIRFNKIDGFTKIYDGNKYFTLFGSEKHDAIYNRIRYIISLKSAGFNNWCTLHTYVRLLLSIHFFLMDF